MEIYCRRKVAGPPFKDGEEMKFEGVRVTTFIDWPKRAKMWPTRLAKAGFYYTGRQEQVACFSCGGRLNTSKAGNSPMTEHKCLFPRCKFVTGCDSTNVPLGETLETPTWCSGRHGNDSSNVPLGAARDIPDDAQRCRRDRRNRSANRRPVAASSRDQCDGSTSLSCRTNEINQPYPRSQYESLPSSSDRHAPGRSQRIPGMLAGAAPLVTDRPFTSQDLQDMKLESKRLDSFMDWPHFVGVSKEHLAKAGLYYLGITDRVRCAFCSGILRNWESGDEPMAEHRKFFPNCAFVTDPHAAGNVTIEEEYANPQLVSQVSFLLVYVITCLCNIMYTGGTDFVI